jgi:transcription-repair coupling factor (superfamily II helicase)
MAYSAGMKFESLHTRLESILERQFDLRSSGGDAHLRLVGTSSVVSIGFFLSQVSSKSINNLPHLVVTPRFADALRFQQALSFFDSQRSCEVLPEFDVSPFSGLDPKPQSQGERIRFLHRAQNSRSGEVFVASIASLQQRTLPFKALAQHSFRYRKDCDLPADLIAFLNDLGYQASPTVEDMGQYAVRGGIVDIFSPAHSDPVRLELFGDTIESLRTFSAMDQRSLNEISEFILLPRKETLWLEENHEALIERFRASTTSRNIDRSELDEVFRALARKNSFRGQEFLLPFFYKDLASPIEHFSSELNIWFLDPLEIHRQADQLLMELKSDFNTSSRSVIRPPLEGFFDSFESLKWPDGSRQIELSGIDMLDLSSEGGDTSRESVPYQTHNVFDISNLLTSQTPGSDVWLASIKQKFKSWKEDDYRIFIAIKNKSQAERIRLLLEKVDWRCHLAESNEGLWQTWCDQQQYDKHSITLIPRLLPESLRLDEERLVFLRDEDLLGKKTRVREYSASEDFQKQAKRLAFGDLKPGDCVVHVLHGVGVYDGLKVMNIGGVESEFIQVGYKDKDKLYLPVYRVGQLQKFSGTASTSVLDKLGGPGWEKTKSKVKGHLRDLAADLLALYAKRAEMHRPPISVHEDEFTAFEASFPYDETQDQDRAIRDLIKDLTSSRPMDRLICGDVGFGKTEVAMRAAFLAAHARKQVAVLAPTTVLTFQHFETFKKRFKGWPLEIRELNRFVSNADAKKTLIDVKEGKIDILIGTHRLLSKDVVFKDLGLLIVDEEQKFGVAHKEKIKKLKSSVDTLAMSATPIPRTLNMSLVGIRDLSIINTAPVDRLPTRTFICKWDEETIRKSIESEISRGGQIYFIHNRVQSIYGLADEVRKIVPQARIGVGHGQMDEDQLEKVMISFFNHEIDVLICTTIVESGMDVPRANTMFIDQAHMMGLSQLYQLRGRVGRSKQRAYCYLILPRDKQIDKTAQERLKVIQENTALGSGIRIAQYDLELRGAGNVLGEDQSGHINSVGYEMYMDLLNEAVHELRGDPVDDMDLEPEINLRIPAMIPEKYISDIRLRLSYYKALADIRSAEELEKIEEELKDQFGELPEPTLNLMGLMLIRSECKKLGVRDISAGLKNISVIFTEHTRMKPETVIQLAMKENKKYAITPDNRLNIRMNQISWPAVFEELVYLQKLI